MQGGDIMRFLYILLVTFSFISSFELFAYVKPNPQYTPGRLCTAQDPNFEKYDYPAHVAKCNRSVGPNEKAIIGKNYGIFKTDWNKYEFDHLIPLNAGGSDQIENIWPQPKDEALKKDVVEQQTYDGLKNGSLTQEQAIQMIRDWFGDNSIAPALKGASDNTTTNNTSPDTNTTPASMFSSATNTNEPSYCNPSTFSKFEISPPANSSKILNLHVYRLGHVVLAGMAIGKSPTSAMEALAKSYSAKVDQVNYCTWFVGSGNSSAQKAFNYLPVPNLFTLNINNAASTFMNILGSSFFQDNNNFISCAETDGYLAVGCNEQQHRGPSVFGMILAFSGCTPEHATAIANNIWGLNGIKQEVRLSIVKAAYDYGNANHNDQAKLEQQLSN